MRRENDVARVFTLFEKVFSKYLHLKRQNMAVPFDPWAAVN